MMTAKVRFENKVSSCSCFSNTRQASTPLSAPELELKTSVSLGRSSSSAVSNTRQQPRSLNPARFRGNWAGFLTQPGRTWDYEMSLRRIGTSRFTGTSVITDLNNPSVFGVMSLRGRVVNGALLFKEIRITDQNPPPGSRWCIKGGRLQISVSNGRVFLRGPWSDPGCNSGQIRLKRK